MSRIIMRRGEREDENAVMFETVCANKEARA